MIIDITNIIARDIRAGDILYNIILDKWDRVLDTTLKQELNILHFDDWTLALKHKDIFNSMEYRLFREIIFE